MHSLNHAVMGNIVAAERAGRPMVRAVSPRPNAPQRPCAPRGVRRRPLARRLDREMARRAVRNRRRGPRAAPDITAPGDRSPSSPPTVSIRELAGIPSGNRQPVARRGDVPPGGETFEHFHRVSEEIYYFTPARAGCGSATTRPTSAPATS